MMIWMVEEVMFLMMFIESLGYVFMFSVIISLTDRARNIYTLHRCRND
jgi:hypothetical protein